MGRAVGKENKVGARRQNRKAVGVEAIIEGVRAMGFAHAYTVGGYERDLLLGRESKDVDFAVSGHSQEDLLARARKEGTVGELRVATQLIGVRLRASWTPADGIEIALARTEVSTGGGRHAFAVSTHPDVTIEEDLRRRDFTCNAIARCVYTGELIDPFNGADDIQAGILRTVSERSFPEDPLRVLRGLARCAKDGCYPEPTTLAQMREFAADPKRYVRANAGQLLRDYIQRLKDNQLPDAELVADPVITALIAHGLWDQSTGMVEGEAVDVFAASAIDNPRMGTPSPIREALTGYRWYGEMPLSPERVFEEMRKTFSGDNAADTMRLARDIGLLPHLLPEIKESIGFAQRSKYHDMSVDDHSLLVLEHACAAAAAESVRWAALLHDNAKPATAWGYLLDDDGREYAAPAQEYERASAERKLPGDEHLHFYARPPRARADGSITDAGGRAHEDLGAERVRTTMNRFAAGSGNHELTSEVVLLVREHMYADDADFATISPSARARRARRFLHRVGRDHAENLMLLRRCDRAGKREGALAEGWDAEISAFESAVREQMHAPMSTKELAINGNDLMALGLRGPAIGVAQRALLERVVENPDDNVRETLLTWAVDEYLTK